MYTSGFDGLTFLAELGSVAKMFTGAFARFVKFASKYDPKTAGSMYLEVRYGWRPLISDIVGISELIRNLDRPARRVYKGWHGASSSATSTASTYISRGGPHPLVVKVNWKLTHSVNERVNVYSMVEPPAVLFDPVITGHEKIPLSFVLDWFLDVGTWLKAMRAASFHSDAIAAYGVQHIYKAVVVSAEFVRPGYAGSAFASSEYELTVSQRSPMSADAPSLPRPNFDLTGYKAVDILLIAKQWFDGTGSVADGRFRPKAI
jgi:hypothetical protein